MQNLENYHRIIRFFEEKSGIKINLDKTKLIENRLSKRQRFHGFATLDDYVNWLVDSNNLQSELSGLFDVLTTNKSSFFREADHFTFLQNLVIPKLNGAIKGLSAVCSSGQEVYTSLMVLRKYLEDHQKFNKYSMDGIDVSQKILNQAIAGVYPKSELRDIPPQYYPGNIMLSKDPKKGIFRIGPRLREKANFYKVNLLHIEQMPTQTYDFIFFRNVMIYFPPEVQKLILKKMIHLLKPGGFLFIGHSESIGRYSLPLQQIGPAVFRLV